ncbi:AfsR/SARP family transcriptional regulator [Streptomyces sp. NPDC019443]|uniref:AfsR/SARP family transcriptional regulator n=1 Tax=Streptomyces sp. NPDC019443 TaxID=3365061 RepID=UPI0037B329C4
MRFAVLGPISAWRGTEEIELGPPKQRAVLAALLLAEGAQVSAGALVDAVWGSAVPASAVSTLRGYVHRLRQLLEPGVDKASSVIQSVGDGYRVHTTPDELDLGAFRRFLAQAEQARRAGNVKDMAGHLRDALALWRGPALAGLRGEYAENQRQRLSELQLSAMAARLTAELELGAHAEITGELTDQVADHPLDERFRNMLMLALYRSGRQAAALDTYREAQALLADELGVDPGPELQAMYQRVLRADPGLLGPAAPAEHAAVSLLSPKGELAVPAQLPADLAVFVGRETQLAEATRLVPGGTVVISAIAGMAGVGKTVFAVHWARQIAHLFPDGQICLDLRGFDPDGVPVPPERALRTVLESLGVPPQSLPRDPSVLAAHYRTLIADRQILLLLDNARDAEQVRPLLPGAPGSLVIITSRNRLAGLIAKDGALPLHLDVLSPAEARDLLARRLGHRRVAAEPEAVDEIIELCARLPLALAVTAARAAVQPAFPLAAVVDELCDSRGRLDAFSDLDAAVDVRAVFSWSYHALTPDAARLFRLLAVHPGPDISLRAAASLAGLSVQQVRRLLAELTQAHLVDERTPGRFASHDLLRAYAGELAETVDDPEELRATRHRIYDHYLYSAVAAGEPAFFIRHRIALTPLSPEVCPEEFTGSKQRASAWFAAEQPVLLAVVHQAEATRFDQHTWQLAWAIEHYLGRHGQWRELESALLMAMAAARRLADPTAEAHVLRGLAQAQKYAGETKYARTRLERAIELFGRAGEKTALAETHRQLSVVLEQQGDFEAALHNQKLCLQLLPNTPDNDKLRTWARNGVGWYNALLGRYEEAIHHGQTALALAQEQGDDYGAVHIFHTIGYAQHHLGQYAEAADCFEHALELIRRVGGLPWAEATTLMHLGDTWLSLAHPDAARTAWTNGLHILEKLRHSDAELLRARLRELDKPSGPARSHTHGV